MGHPLDNHADLEEFFPGEGVSEEEWNSSAIRDVVNARTINKEEYVSLIAKPNRNMEEICALKKYCIETTYGIQISESLILKFGDRTSLRRHCNLLAINGENLDNLAKYYAYQSKNSTTTAFKNKYLLYCLVLHILVLMGYTRVDTKQDVEIDNKKLLEFVNEHSVLFGRALSLSEPLSIRNEEELDIFTSDLLHDFDLQISY